MLTATSAPGAAHRLAAANAVAAVDGDSVFAGAAIDLVAAGRITQRSLLRVDQIIATATDENVPLRSALDDVVPAAAAQAVGAVAAAEPSGSSAAPDDAVAAALA